MTAGQRISLFCNVTWTESPPNNTEFHLTWFDSEKNQVFNRSDFFTVEDTVYSGGSLSGHLVFPNTRTSQAGSYSCVVSDATANITVVETINVTLRSELYVAIYR